MEDDEFLDLVAQGAAEQAEGGGGEHVDVVLGVDADFLDLVALDAAPRRRKHEQRSWQLMERARAAKERKRVERREGQAEQRWQRVQGAVQELQLAFPGIVRSVGLPDCGAARGFTEDRAAVLSKLAFRPAIRTRDSTAVRQRQAVVLVAKAAEARQA